MYVKAVKTAEIIELYEYEKLNVKAKGGRKERQDGEQEETNYRNRQRLRRSMVRRLAANNFDSSSKFVTLTFAENLTDIERANKAFRDFIKRLRRQVPKFKYLAVIEFQKRGAVHYHLLLDMPYFKASDLGKVWGNGFVKIRRIDNVDNVGAYIVKYMNKDLDDGRLKGKKAYLMSDNLDKPQEYRSWKDSEIGILNGIIEDLEKKGASVVYSSTYQSERAGAIAYKQYNPNRKKEQG